MLRVRSAVGRSYAEEMQSRHAHMYAGTHALTNAHVPCAPRLHSARQQAPSLSSGENHSRQVVSPRFASSETLRKRIESDLKMLSLSDDEDSSGGSTPRELLRDFKSIHSESPNNGLLC
jgi:hypothetical protein